MKNIIHLSAEFTSMVTGHGLTTSNVHSFKIIPNSTCLFGLKEGQTNNSIILNCTQKKMRDESYEMSQFEQVTPGPLCLNNTQEKAPRLSRRL